MADPMEWLQQLLDGTADPATLEHVRRSFRTWSNSGRRAVRDADGRPVRARPVSLSRCFGLPDNPEVARKRMRDDYLRRAARELVATLPPTRSLPVALRDEALRFLRHRWLCWCEFDFPPPNVRELDRLLFFATKAGGGALPASARQYAYILKS